MKGAIDWPVFPELLKELFRDQTDQGGGQNIPVTTMVKILFQQKMYNLANEQAEK